MGTGKNDFSKKQGERQMIFLSVIIPIYNVEEYLVQCIDSILAQSSEDIEVILVDDGSTDKSGSICDEYAKNYKNITLVHQCNQGSGLARNAGMELATGQFIWYVDSDDYIADNAIQYIKGNLKEKLDILLFGATSFSDGAEVISRYKRTANLNVVMSGKELIEKSFQANEYITSVCLRVYRKQFLINHSLFFGAEKLYEDEQYSFISLFYADKVKVTDLPLYMRRYRQGSKMVEAREKSEENFLKSYEGYGNAIDKLLSTYVSSTDNLDQKLLLIQTSKYYFSIMSKYIMLNKEEQKKNKALKHQLNGRMYKYKKEMTSKAKIVMYAPVLYKSYKRLKDSLKKY